MKLSVLIIIAIVEFVLMVLHIMQVNIRVLTINKNTYECLKDDKPLIRKYHNRSAIFMAAGFIATLVCIYCYCMGFVKGMIIGWAVMIVSVIVYSVRINAR